MKYDDASWHLGDDFPADVNRHQAVVHMGMFLGWAINQNLAGDYLLTNHAISIQRFRARQMTGADIVETCCDERLTDEDLNDLGNRFALDYYDTDIYIDDFDAEFGAEVSSLYLVEDNWENFDRMAKRITIYFNAWQSQDS